MKKLYNILYLVVFVIIIVFLAYVLINSQDNTEIYYKVVNIVDGDTMDVNINGNIERVRLIGIDTPELVDPRQPVECFAREASDKAKEVLSNQKVRLESDITQGDRDKYGRLLRYIWLEDGTNFNKLMIAQGFAHEYTYDFPYRYQDEFRQAENYVRNNKTGIWGQCNFVE
ncbi:MAG: thermonuclease family protein [bacterium]